LKEKIYYIFNNTRIPSKVSSMSIENCPVLKPTWKEFRNFS